MTVPASPRRVLGVAWTLSLGAAVGVRLWNALTGPVLHGYDAWAHVAYVLFLDLYHALPYGDQGWSYFHPPLYYLLGFVIAQLGDGDVLARGLALIGSAASLGVAGLTAWLVRAALPGPRWLACVAFTAVAFLPVHLYVSPMPGNEMLATLFSTATIAVFLRDETLGVRRDALVGFLAGLALLSKYNALVPVGAVGATLLLRAVLAESRASALGVAVQRGLVIAGVALVVAGPVYLRNWIELGTPLSTSHDDAKVAAKESGQPPGVRGLRDFVLPPGPDVLVDSGFDAPAVVRSVWGSVYLSSWFDIHRAGQFPRWEIPGVVDRPIHRTTLAMAAFGLVPSLLAAIGAGLVFARLRRRPAAGKAAEGAVAVDLGLAVLTVLALAFFVAFAVRIPTFAAVKASYLLNLSVVYGWCIARAVLWLGGRRGWAAGVAVAFVGVAAVAASVVFTSGLVHPRRADHPDVVALRAYFGNVEAGRAWLAAPGVAERRHAVELVAAAELANGESRRARELLVRIAGSDVTPEFVNALATATALSGGYRQALRLWDELLAVRAFPEARINRGAVRARVGDLEGAREDLERALDREAGLAAGWRTLATLHERQGRSAEAASARARAMHYAARPPRGFPYGIGDGELESAGRGERWMLSLEDETLSLYRAPRSRWLRRANR